MKYITSQTCKAKIDFYKLQQKEPIKLKIVILCLQLFLLQFLKIKFGLACLWSNTFHINLSCDFF